MTLLSVVKDVCAVVGVAIPDAVIPSLTGNRTMQEMLALANEMARRIAYDNCEWVVMRASALHTGDGIKGGFLMPANYKRLLLTSNVWRSGFTQQPMRFITDHDEWVRRSLGNIVDPVGEWILSRGTDGTTTGLLMYIRPTLAIGATATFFYLDKNCIRLASGGLGDAFMSDNDTFMLDERLLTLGMIWQWKANKGGAYAEDLGTYADALSFAQGSDKPMPIIIGRRPISASARTAYPWPVPT
jgi:hypothetical protein